MIWETDAAVSGSDGELELQADGWEPFGVCYVPSVDDSNREGFVAVMYRRQAASKRFLEEQRGLLEAM